MLFCNKATFNLFVPASASVLVLYKPSCVSLTTLTKNVPVGNSVKSVNAFVLVWSTADVNVELYVKEAPFAELSKPCPCPVVNTPSIYLSLITALPLV